MSFTRPRTRPRAPAPTRPDVLTRVLPVRLASALAVVLALGTVAAPGPARAQGMEMTIGGLRVAAGLPVEVTADQLQVDQTTGLATFSGAVVVIQGDMRLSADEVQVEYGTGGDGPRRIARLLASGSVTLASPNEAAEAREAVYTIDDRRIVMTGDVVLTQGPNVVTGQRLVANLADGTAVMEGRVRTIIETGGGGSGGGSGGAGGNR